MNRLIVVACATALLATGEATAQVPDLAEMAKQLESLQLQVQQLRAALAQQTEARPQLTVQQGAPPGAPLPSMQAAAETPIAGAAAPVTSTAFPPKLLQFMTESTVYGNLDVSMDVATKGLQKTYVDGGTPVGRMGWMPAVSTNISYLGWRGAHPISADRGTSLLWQLETQIDIAATAGTANTNSSNDTTVKGALTSRNSYIGIAGAWGTVKIGKTDAPYKNSTSTFNPFFGMLGDYLVIMGNTGGDNRVEFGGRLDHSVWYESPEWHGWRANVLFSPGQNRTTDNGGIAAGESGCTGGNAPGSGALPPLCSDGAFGDAFSANLSYSNGLLYATVAYELHKNVNRVSDTIGVPTTPDAFAALGDPNDIGDEAASKIGATYALPTHTVVGAIYERLTRNLPAYLAYQNERQRVGYWLFATQTLSQADTVSIGWGHANHSLGDPGQHNSSPGLNPDNSANLYSFAYKHEFAKNTWIYFDYAQTANSSAAHYDLGAGGRSVTTDCHDGSILTSLDVSSGTPTVVGDGPHCFAGGKLQGASVGLDFKF